MNLKTREINSGGQSEKGHDPPEFGDPSHFPFLTAFTIDFLRFESHFSFFLKGGKAVPENWAPLRVIHADQEGRGPH